MVFGCLLKASDRIVGGNPARDRVEEPQSCEMVAVRDRGRLGRLATVAARGRVEDPGIGCRGRGRGSVGGHPPAQRLGASDRQPLIREVAVNDPLQVGVQHGSLQPRCCAHDAGEAATHDLVRVVRQGEPRLPLHHRRIAGENLRQGDGRSLEGTLMQSHGTHAQGQDAPGAGMGSCGIDRSCRSRQQEATRWRSEVHLPSNRVPHQREPLPLVDQHRSVGQGRQREIRLCNCALRGVIQEPCRHGPPLGRIGLPDALRAIQRNRGSMRHEFIEFSIDGAMKVAHDLYPTVFRSTTLPFSVAPPYRFQRFK